MSHTHLTLFEREVIAQMLAAGKNQSQIARHLGRAPRTISRELRHNKVGGAQTYFAVQADWLAGERRWQAKEGFAQHGQRVWDYVKAQLAEGWSPEQIVGRMRRKFPDDARMRIAHCLAQIHNKHKPALDSPLTLRFQTRQEPQNVAA